MATTTRTISFREEVERVDGKSRHVESLYSIVYRFSGNKNKRDTGPSGGAYN